LEPGGGAISHPLSKRKKSIFKKRRKKGKKRKKEKKKKKKEIQGQVSLNVMSCHEAFFFY
jgi:hypothetical protein